MVALNWPSPEGSGSFWRLALPRLRSPSFHRYIKHIRQTDLLPVSDSPGSFTAFAAALDRRSQIMQFLGRGREASDTREGAEVPRREFLEIYERSELDIELPTLDLGPAIGQQARLDWQLDRVELLLLDRVIDHVEILRRRGVINTITCVRAICAPSLSEPNTERYSAPDDPIFAALRHVPAGSIGGAFLNDFIRNHFKWQRFPWRVVIESTDPWHVRRVLSEERHLSWFGIGIDVAPSRGEPEMSLSCEVSGERGVVGGRLSMARKKDNNPHLLGMTCAHVVSKHCKCVVAVGWSPDDRAQGGTTAANPVVHEPDAALIAPASHLCDCELSSTSTEWVATRTSIDPEHSAIKQPTTRLTPRERTRRLGYVFNPLAYYPMKGRIHRVPSIDIKPYSYATWSAVFRHPFEKTFSSPGDSGSWVIDVADDSKWYGMISANEPTFGSSYAIDSRYLCNYFAEKLRHEYQRPDLIEALERGPQ